MRIPAFTGRKRNKAGMKGGGFVWLEGDALRGSSGMVAEPRVAPVASPQTLEADVGFGSHLDHFRKRDPKETPRWV